MDSDLDAEFGRQRARVDSYKDDGGRGRLANYPNTQRVHAGALNPLPLEVQVHGGTDSLFPDSAERVRSERSQLLGIQVGFRTRRPHPDVGTGASDKAGLGW